MNNRNKGQFSLILIRVFAIFMSFAYPVVVGRVFDSKSDMKCAVKMSTMIMDVKYDMCL